MKPVGNKPILLGGGLSPEQLNDDDRLYLIRREGQRDVLIARKAQIEREIKEIEAQIHELKQRGKFR